MSSSESRHWSDGLQESGLIDLVSSARYRAVGAEVALLIERRCLHVLSDVVIANRKLHAQPETRIGNRLVVLTQRLPLEPDCAHLSRYGSQAFDIMRTPPAVPL